MKKIILCASFLLVVGCETNQVCYQENCFITETKVTEDMRKIMKIMLDFQKEELDLESERKLKIIHLACSLYGKDNKKLNKELDKISKFYETKEKQLQQRKRNEFLKKSLKGLTLNYSQVLLLSKEMLNPYIEMKKHNHNLYEQYIEKSGEILKDMRAKEDAEEEFFWTHDKYGINQQYWFEIFHTLRSIHKFDCSIFSAYNTLIFDLFYHIAEGVLSDTFFDKMSSSLGKDEETGLMLMNMSSIYCLIPPVDKNGIIIFDSVKKSLSNKHIDKKELMEKVNEIAYYLQSLASGVVSIQHDVTDKIDYEIKDLVHKESELNNFYDYRRWPIISIVNKYPKQEDFEKEIDKLSTKLSYATYYNVNTSRFLYKELLSKYHSQLRDFFGNAQILAEKLYLLCKDDKVSESAFSKQKYEHKNSMQNIEVIREIVKIGHEKILSTPDCYIDSKEEIKKSYKNMFMQIRKFYLNNCKQRKS